MFSSYSFMGPLILGAFVVDLCLFNVCLYVQLIQLFIDVVCCKWDAFGKIDIKRTIFTFVFIKFDRFRVFKSWFCLSHNRRIPYFCQNPLPHPRNWFGRAVKSDGRPLPRRNFSGDMGIILPDKYVLHLSAPFVSISNTFVSDVASPDWSPGRTPGPGFGESRPNHRYT